MKLFPLSLATLLCFLLNSISAQNDKKGTPQYKYAFKGYLNFLDEKKTTISIQDTLRTLVITSRRSAILPAIGWSRFRKNGQFTEIGITRLGFDFQELENDYKVFDRDSLGNLVPGGDIPSIGSKVWTNNIGLRFEWNFPFYHKENRAFNTYLGISMDPSVYFQKNDPLNAATFGTRVFEFSNTLTVIPRITYSLSSRCFLDLNVPISFTTFGINYKYDRDPRLPTSARETTDFKINLPTNIAAIRLGIGYKI